MGKMSRPQTPVAATTPTERLLAVVEPALNVTKTAIIADAATRHQELLIDINEIKMSIGAGKTPTQDASERKIDRISGRIDACSDNISRLTERVNEILAGMGQLADVISTLDVMNTRIARIVAHTATPNYADGPSDILERADLPPAEPAEEVATDDLLDSMFG